MHQGPAQKFLDHIQSLVSSFDKYNYQPKMYLGVESYIHITFSMLGWQLVNPWDVRKSYAASYFMKESSTLQFDDAVESDHQGL